MAVDTVDQSSAVRAAEPTGTANTLGVLLTLTAVTSFVVCLVGFALRQADVGVSAASIALLATGAALSWLTAESRRVRDAQRIAH